MLQIRQAKPEDYEAIREFYYTITDDMQNAEYKPGWEKDVYPAQEYLQEAIETGQLYIGFLEDELVSCMIVNHSYNDGYEGTEWAVEASDEELLVIHALGVSYSHGGKGYAKEMVCHVIDMARKKGIKALRLDVLEGNLPAEKVYTSLGFQCRGHVQMFYEDTGWTGYDLYEYLILP